MNTQHIPTYRSLSEPWQWLIAEIQRVGYGHVHKIRIRSGEPDKGHPPACAFTRRPGRKNPSTRKAICKDFVLRAEILDLIEDLKDFSGECDIAVNDSNPSSWTLREMAA